jgi:hypothetical protein
MSLTAIEMLEEELGGTPDWPDPQPLANELPPVGAFNCDLLPASFTPLVMDVAERMQVPEDYPAVVMILCLAGAVNRRAMIQPKANDRSWLVVPNLWGGIVAPPGFMKSPVIQAVSRPMLQIQSKWLKDYDGALDTHHLEVEEYEMRHAAWKENFKANFKRKKSAPERPVQEQPVKPNLRRLIINDGTFEAIHQVMSQNPAGIFVIRDELTGWWSQLDRAGREGERAFCLQAWNGDTSHTIDRISRGTVHVEGCCMSMLGGIQPGRLRSYLVDALKDGPANDGLIQRFQLLVWPDTESEFTYVDRPQHAQSERMVESVLGKLVDLDATDPKRLQFAPDAQELFIDWYTRLQVRVRGDEFHPALASHLGKYAKLMPALALLFELAEWAAGNGSLSTVSQEHARKAIAWCDYLETHASRVYSCVVSPQVHAARELAEKIRKRKLGDDKTFFSCRDVYSKGWTALDSPESAQSAIEFLQEAFWVRETCLGNGPKGGRPSTRYRINPRVWEQ